jgi:hypothetical protein
MICFSDKTIKNPKQLSAQLNMVLLTAGMVKDISFSPAIVEDPEKLADRLNLALSWRGISERVTKEDIEKSPKKILNQAAGWLYNNNQ